MLYAENAAPSMFPDYNIRRFEHLCNLFCAIIFKNALRKWAFCECTISMLGTYITCNMAYNKLTNIFGKSYVKILHMYGNLIYGGNINNTLMEMFLN